LSILLFISIHFDTSGSHHEDRNCFLCLSCLLKAYTGMPAGRNVIARTNQGVCHGIKVHVFVDAFLGIPYAQPPTGHLRFRPPRPLQSQPQDHKNILNATAFGPVCNQFHYKTVPGDTSYQRLPNRRLLNLTYSCRDVRITIRPSPSICLVVWRRIRRRQGQCASFQPYTICRREQDIIVVIGSEKTLSSL